MILLHKACYYWLTIFFLFLSLTNYAQLPIWADSCVGSSFRGRILGNSNSGSTINNVHSYIDDDIIATGWNAPSLPGSESQVYGLVMRLSPSGTPRWVRHISFDDNPQTASRFDVYTSVITSNNDIVCVLNLDIVRLDASGNTVWKRKLWPAQFGYVPEQIIETADNGFLVTGIDIGSRSKIFKLDAQGVLVWKENFTAGSLFHTRSVTESPQAYYLMGFTTEPNGAGEQNFVIKMNKANGQVIWSKGLHKTTPAGVRYVEEMYDQIVFKDGLLHLTGNSRVNFLPKSIQATLTINEEGEFVDARKMENSEISVAQSYIWRDRQFDIGSQTGVQYNINGDIYAYRLNQQDQPIWAWHYPLPNHDWVNDMAVFEDSSVVIGGYNRGLQFESPQKAQVIKTTREGKMGDCSNLPFQVTVTHFIETVSPVTILIGDETLDNAVSTVYIFDGITGFQWQLECVTETICKVSRIEGPVIACSAGTTLYKVTRGGSCVNPVNFTASPGVQLQWVSDTSVNIIASSPGIVRLYANMNASCGVLKDSLLITILDSPGSVDLGPDKTICTNNQMVLQAGNGYISYLWQDGSTEPSFIVNAPGVYSVQVTDACGITSNDNIIIAAHAPVSVDAGDDRLKCNNDTLHLSAPTGLLQYNWYPDYNINSVTASTVIVNPVVDTAYILTAEVEPGCFAFDTIRIRVLHSPAIDLGDDLQFCEGRQVTLNAGNQFSGYTWNTGAPTPSITVNTEGTYIIAAEYSNNCISRDTINVLPLFPNPVIDIHQDTTLCEGASRQLTPGNGYAGYLWQDGAVVPVITINNLGKYWVQVTDAHGCNGSDTVIIDNRLPAPKQFLFADTSICSYNSISLMASSNFNTYQWSTNASSKTILINQAGVYWLEVTDQYNCRGRDSVTVMHKNCPNGFFIPSAFTPDNDGVNDVFRPRIFGEIKMYDFKVYNRWGHIVFSSKRINEGWNGMVKGTPTDSGVFVWYCTYQFEGEEPKTSKGTFVLIR